jgi:hypothetical protein
MTAWQYQSMGPISTTNRPPPRLHALPPQYSRSASSRLTAHRTPLLAHPPHRQYHFRPLLILQNSRPPPCPPKVCHAPTYHSSLFLSTCCSIHRLPIIEDPALRNRPCLLLRPLSRQISHRHMKRRSMAQDLVVWHHPIQGHPPLDKARENLDLQSRLKSHLLHCQDQQRVLHKSIHPWTRHLHPYVALMHLTTTTQRHGLNVAPTKWGGIQILK